MKRNWTAIIQISCPRTRLALATCTTRELLRLQSAFPECFGEGEETVFATWSDVLHQYISQHSDNPDACRSAGFLWASSYAQIPGALQFGSNSNADPIPHELLDQIVRIPALAAPLVLIYQGSEWIVGELRNVVLSAPIQAGDPGSLFVQQHEGYCEQYLTIVPKEMIAIDL